MLPPLNQINETPQEEAQDSGSVEGSAQDVGQDNLQGMGREPATPEEQAQYEKTIQNAMSTLHGENSDAIIDKLSEGQPEEAVAEVVASLIIKLYESAEQAGKPLEDSVMMFAGDEILNEVVNMGVISGAFGEISEDEGEDIQQEAMLLSMDKVGRYLEQQGRFDREALKQGMDDANNGKYDSMLQEG